MSIPTLEEIAAYPHNYGSAPAELAAVLIVQRRRLDALEQQARPYQEDGHLAVGEPTSGWWMRRCAWYQEAAETAERERDEWKADAARAWSEYSRKLDELVTRTTQRDEALELRGIEVAKACERRDAYAKDADAARASVERLRRALVQIEDTGCFDDLRCEIARKALEEERLKDLDDVLAIIRESRNPR